MLIGKYTDAKRFEPLTIPERNRSVPPERDFAPFEERVSDNPEIEKLIDEYVETYKEGGFLPGRDGGGETDVSRGRDGGTTERERLRSWKSAVDLEDCGEIAGSVGFNGVFPLFLGKLRRKSAARLDLQRSAR